MSVVVVVGAGPAGLAAAEVLSQAGQAVHVYDAMPSVGRKFLLAGLGGLNLTHAEPSADFVTRYGEGSPWVSPWLQAFGAQALRDWAQGLGVPTFVGSSGRVFPQDMKAAPLLRAWLHRLKHPTQGVPVRFFMRHRWVGWGEAAGARTLQFEVPPSASAPAGLVSVRAGQAVILALGGASWPRLGSDGSWQGFLSQAGVPVARLRPANCGFEVQASPHAVGGVGGWSERFERECAGAPLKGVVLSTAGFARKGECVLTRYGVEGSLVYAASSFLRQSIEQHGQAPLELDLLPDWSEAAVSAAVAHPRGSKSWGSHLRSRLRLDGAKLALVWEVLPKAAWSDPAVLARTIKHLPLTVLRPRPIEEAISSAGGVTRAGLTQGLQLKDVPGVWCAGEMLDWEAPTGGYLLTACVSSGRFAAQDVLRSLRRVGH